MMGMQGRMYGAYMPEGGPVNRGHIIGIPFGPAGSISLVLSGAGFYQYRPPMITEQPDNMTLKKLSDTESNKGTVGGDPKAEKYESQLKQLAERNNGKLFIT